MKALEKRFDEFAYFMSSGAVKPIPTAAVFSTTLKTYIDDAIGAYEATVRAEAAAMAEREQASREASEAKARAEAAALAISEAESEARRQEDIRQLQLEKARLVAERTENAALVVEIREQVHDWGLAPGSCCLALTASPRRANSRSGYPQPTN